MNRKKKVNQPQPQQPQQVKKSVLKTNNEQTKKDEPIKKEKLPKANDEQTIATKKKITVTKTIDKKKSSIPTTVKSTSKVTKTSVSTPKRPSTDESNESAKKMKLDDEKPKIVAIEEQPSLIKSSSTITTIQTESEILPTSKPSIVLTTPSDESSTTLPKVDEPSIETNSQTTPTKFGIVFPSHHRHSTTTTTPPPSSSSIRAQSTETLVTLETSKNADERMENDNESISVNINNNDTTIKDEQIISNTLKPPTVTAQPPLSDDETLNPETMQLSDLISTSRHEETKPTQSRSTARTTGKGKRGPKPDTTTNKRQQTKANSITSQSIISSEKQPESIKILVDSIATSSVEQPTPTLTTVKRLSTTEPASVSCSINDKEPKRLRISTDDPMLPSQDKIETTEKSSQLTNKQIKEDTIEPTLVSEKAKQDTPPLLRPVPSQSQLQPLIDQSQVTPMETDQIPLSSSIITSTKSPSTTSAETETAIKALCSSIQIPPPPPPLSKISNPEKTAPIIAPISRETLPIVEHKPASITTPSVLPSHVPIKSS
ncbi:unnamed protein product, partial [Rotaria magnacalcarata]